MWLKLTTVVFLAGWFLVALPSLQAEEEEGEEFLESAISSDPGGDYLLQFYPDPADLPLVMETEFPVFPAVRVGGGFRKIWGVDVNRPYYFFNRRKVYVREGQKVAFLPVSHFAGQFVDLNIIEEPLDSDADFTGFSRPKTEWVHLPESTTGAKRSLVSRFAVTPDNSIRRAFIAHVFFDDEMNSKVFWRQIGSLREGQTREVEMVTDPLHRDGRYPHNFILVFSAVGEHRTSRRVEISKSLAALDLKWTRNFVQYYVDGNPLADLPAFPIYHGSMILPLELLEAQNGGSVRIMIDIDENGYVDNPTIEKGLDRILDAASIRNVATWKFFPPLEEGFASSTKAIVPIVFNPDDEEDS